MHNRDYRIDIVLVEGMAEDVEMVQAHPDPFPEDREIVLQPGDTVTWNLPPNREMRVEFVEVQDHPVAHNPVKPLDTPLGPFKSLTVEDSRIVGTVGDDIPKKEEAKRFYYSLYEEGKKLPWAQGPPQDESGGPLGGGIDLPKKPPRGGND